MFKITVFFSGSFCQVLRGTEEDSISETVVWPISFSLISSLLLKELTFIFFTNPKSSLVAKKRTSNNGYDYSKVYSPQAPYDTHCQNGRNTRSCTRINDGQNLPL